MSKEELRPAHYQRGTIQPIVFIEDQQLNFNLGNVVKYIARAGFKEGESRHKDLGKAMFYLERELWIAVNQNQQQSSDDQREADPTL